ncbi:MAG: Hpt domain-containing protein [Desulfovibrio sp.]
MSFDSNDLLQSFVEDSKEHLEDIESTLLDIESAGDDAPEDLINTVFRAAHSLKGGAGMLGLENIKDLAHRLENVLHMIRSDELVATHEIINDLLDGFDKLLELVDNIDESENISIDEQMKKLVAIADANSPEAEQGSSSVVVEDVVISGASMFSIDSLTLRQATKGGNDLYLLEFDLIHDIDKKDRTPLDVIKSLEGTGYIVDCKVDFSSVGGLDDEFSNRIPFYVLFASILEGFLLAGMANIDASQVKELDTSKEIEDAESIEGHDYFGDNKFSYVESSGAIRMVGEQTAPNLLSLQSALIAGYKRCDRLTLDWEKVERVDVFFFQLLCSAKRCFSARGKELFVTSPMPECVTELAGQLGISDACFERGGSAKTLLGV